MSFRASLILSILAAAASLDVQAQQILRLDIAARKIVYSTQTEKLYATIPSTAGAAFGNRVIEISPLDATITNSVFVGSEPNPIAVSPDATVAYVGLDGTARVRAIDLATMTAGVPFLLGSSATAGPYYAEDLQVMPGAADSVIVARRAIGISPRFAGVAVFDNGVMRPTVALNFVGGNSIAWDSQTNSVYGLDNETGGFELSRMTIDASGVSEAAGAEALINAFRTTIIADKGMIFSTTGQAINGATLTTAGSYNISGPVAVDHSVSAVAFARQFGGLDSFDRETYTRTGSIFLSTGQALSATHCGDRCVAVVYDSGHICIVRELFDPIFHNGFEPAPGAD
jgi:DNA-binding beta-propeller fold protein YncE